MNKIIVFIFAALICCPLPGKAEDLRNQDETMRARMGEIRTQARFYKMVDAAAEVYSAITKGPHGEIPSAVLKRTNCIAILPNVITGALLIGVSRGEGVASCRDSSKNTWSQPAPISLNQGSIGLQAGAKSADIVLFFQNDTARQALKRGDFTLGADLSAVAGTFDSAVDTSNAGVVVYARAQGVFAGASINGSEIRKDQKDIVSYYGKNVDYTALLEGRESPDSSGYTQKLIRLFP